MWTRATDLDHVSVDFRLPSGEYGGSGDRDRLVLFHKTQLYWWGPRQHTVEIEVLHRRKMLAASQCRPRHIWFWHLGSVLDNLNIAGRFYTGPFPGDSPGLTHPHQVRDLCDLIKGVVGGAPIEVLLDKLRDLFPAADPLLDRIQGV